MQIEVVGEGRYLNQVGLQLTPAEARELRDSIGLPRGVFGMSEQRRPKTRRESRQFRTAVLPLVLVALFAVTACGGPVEDSPTWNGTRPPKYGDGKERTDLAPLVARFPEVSDATSATWHSGTLGEARGLGPSTFWIDAIVVLPELDFDAIMSEFDLIEREVVPDMVDELLTHVESACPLRSDALDDAWSHGEWDVKVYVCPDTDEVALEAVGG